MNDLTSEDFREWAHNPCTEAFIEKLRETRQTYLEKLGSDFFKAEDIRKVIGLCESIASTITSIEDHRQKEEEADDK